MKVGEINPHFIYVAFNIFGDDCAMKSRTEGCVVVQGNLLFYKMMGFILDIFHDLLIGVSVGRLSFMGITLFLMSLQSLSEGVELLVMGGLVFFVL